MRRFWHIVSALSLGALVWVRPAAGADVAAFTPVMIKGQPAHPTRLLAKVKPIAAASGHASALAANGLQAVRGYDLLPGLVLLDTAPQTQAMAAAAAGASNAEMQAAVLQTRIESLRASGLFEYVEPDYILNADAVPMDSGFTDGLLWGLRNTGQSGGTAGVDIDAVRAWDITKGSRQVIVAVLDTGIRATHADLSAQMWHNPSEIAGNGIDDDNNGYIDDVFGMNVAANNGDVSDPEGHGTHVAGTIGAAANNFQPHIGVAWQVQLMACKILTESGDGFISGAVAGFAYAVAHGARILNCSWGLTSRSRALADAVAAAGAQGVLVVAAAGNDNTSNDTTPHYPSSFEYDNVIAVAAINRLGDRASFSNFGAQSVDLGAPGVEIYSTVALSDTSYGTYQGTSMASPHVAGVAALVRAQFPSISVADLRDRLLNTTTATPALQGVTVTGGRVNAYQAITRTGDGQLKLSIMPGAATTLFLGRATPVSVRVTDLVGVTGATVTGTTSDGGGLTFRDDGVAPDTTSGDARYTATLNVPLSGAQVTLSVTASAPGKTAAAGNVTYSIQAPPTNDHFANRTALTFSSGSTTANNFGGSLEPGEPRLAGQAGGASVWWTWTAPFGANVTIDTVGSSFDTLLGVFTGGSVSTLTEIASNDDIDGPNQPSKVAFGATAGTTYQIAVDGWEGGTGSIALNLVSAIPPPNDHFANRIGLVGSSLLVTGTNLNATGEVGEPQAPGAKPGTSVWWTWTAPSTGTVLVKTNNASFDVSVYSGSSLSTLVRRPGRTGEENGYLHGQITFSAVAGTTYSIAVSSVDAGAPGTFTLSLAASVGPANDLFASAVPITGTNTIVTGTNEGGTREPDEPIHGSSSLGATSWWSWTAPDDGTLVVITDGGGGNHFASVFSGSALSTLVKVNDAAAATLKLQVVKNTIYFIAVDSAFWSGSGAAIKLTLSFDVRPPNDMFADRIVVAGTSFIISGTNVGATREVNEPVFETFIDGSTVWWGWRAPSTGTLVIISNGLDPWVMVYTGAELGTLQRQRNSIQSGRQVRVHVEAGVEYQIAVDSGFFGPEAPFTLAFDFYVAPANDLFSRRATLAGSSIVFSGSTLMATAEWSEDISGVYYDAATVWWTWTAPANGTVLLAAQQSEIEATVSVFTGPELGALSPVSSSATAWPLPRVVRFSAIAGTSYHFSVSSHTSYMGAFKLALSLVTPPPNDNFAQRTVIAGSSAIVTGSTAGATREANEPSAGLPRDVAASIWWTWTAAEDGAVILATTGSDFDTVLAVFSGSPSSPSQVIANDNEASGLLTSRVGFNVTAGSVYYFVVDGVGGASGNVKLGLSFYRRPGNDSFAQRAILQGAAVTVSAANLGATSEANEPYHAGISREASVWWSWTAPTSGRVAVTTANGTFDLVLAVYTGTALDALTPVARSYARESRDADIAFNALAGVTYHIAIAGYASTQLGTVDLTVATVTPPVNEIFAGRVVVPGSSASISSSNLGAMAAASERFYQNDYAGAPLWWTWTAPASAMVAVSTAGSEIDTVLFLYSGSNDGNLEYLAGNDDAAAGIKSSHLSYPIVMGTQYFVLVAGRGGQMGRIDLQLAMGQVPTANLSTVSRAGAGNTLVLEASVSGTGPFSYQWYRDGIAIIGATSADFTIPSVQLFHAGNYSVSVSNDFGTTISSSTSVSVDLPGNVGARLTNLSTRALGLTGDDVLIPGFVVAGTGSKQLLIRAVGPTLGALGVAGVLPDPRLTLKRWNGTAYDDVATNDNWSTNLNAADIITRSAELFAFPLGAGSADAALLVDLAAGQYSVVADDTAGGAGIAIVELYDADAEGSAAQLINISNRGYVGTGDSIMIPGFVVSSEGPKTLLIRAVGPTLASFGVSGVLADPTLSIFRHDFAHNTDELILTNDDWSVGAGATRTRDVAVQVQAFALPEGSKDAAFVVTLNPGVYTVHARGKYDAEGVALVEVYAVP